MDRGLHATGLFFDLTEAYDVVIHDTLLDKLNLCDIRSKTNLWFKSYLTNQVQCVEINQIDHKTCMQNRYISSYREINHGVPGKAQF
jgi:hypothetical protein